MTDKPLVLDVSEDLLLRAQIAHLDLRAVVEKAILSALDSVTLISEQMPDWDPTPLTLAQKEARLAELLPPERLEEGLRLMRAGLPIPALYAGKIGGVDEAMEPLPEDIWGDLFQ